MLELIVGGKHIEYSEISLNFAMKSPIFNDADGSAVFNFTIPTTPKNKKIFGFANRLNIASSNNEYNIIIKYCGLEMFSGILLVNTSQPDFFECSAGISKGAFNYLIKNLTIQQTTPDEIINVAHEDTDLVWGLKLHTEYEQFIDKCYPETNIAVFPIVNDDAMADANNIFQYYKTYYQSNLNFWDIEEQKFLTLVNNINNLAIDIPKLLYMKTYNLFTPFVYNSHVLKNIFAYLNYTLETNPFETNLELSKLVIYQIKLANEKKAEYIFIAGLLNSDVHMYEQKPFLDINVKDYVPEIIGEDYLSGLLNMFGCALFVSNFNRTAKIVFLKDIISSSDIVVLQTKSSDYQITVEPITEYLLSQTFDSEDSLNDMHMVNLNDYNVKDPVVNKSLLLVDVFGAYNNDVRFVENERMYYKCSIGEEYLAVLPYWEKLCYENLLEYGTGTEVIEVKASSPAMEMPYYAQPPYKHQEMLIPHVSQKCIIPGLIPSYKNKCSLRLMFYRGMVEGFYGTPEDSGSGWVTPPTRDLYPLGSNNVYDIDGNKIADANLSLLWDGEYGLYENFWKQWVEQRPLTKIVKIKNLLMPIEIRKLDFSKKYRISDNNYLLKEVRFTITDKDNGPVMAEIDAYLV